METEKLLDLKNVIHFVTSKKTINCSTLQRTFIWGYNKAGRVIDKLEELKIIFIKS